MLLGRSAYSTVMLRLDYLRMHFPEGSPRIAPSGSALAVEHHHRRRVPRVEGSTRHARNTDPFNAGRTRRKTSQRRVEGRCSDHLRIVAYDLGHRKRFSDCSDKSSSCSQPGWYCERRGGACRSRGGFVCYTTNYQRHANYPKRIDPAARGTIRRDNFAIYKETCGRGGEEEIMPPPGPFRTITSGRIVAVTEVHLYEETWKKIIEGHPEFRLPSLYEAVVACVESRATDVYISATRPEDSLVYVDAATTNIHAQPLRVPVRLYAGTTSGWITSAYFATSKTHGTKISGVGNG
jgi:hypothetical protein